ncbi:hypothetical protein KIN20_033690 [Parelaphostrongylus tenuis]|uniref:Uncharacterized protein n=1 Tax=Parelaphostrongylus tenuis TaxID=148309 RepID=A0AAD5R924_PARTN|nr:hypothetical protein KIN20_033690 [Parelaphostrongylus tenuis]
MNVSQNALYISQISSDDPGNIWPSLKDFSGPHKRLSFVFGTTLLVRKQQKWSDCHRSKSFHTLVSDPHCELIE